MERAWILTVSVLCLLKLDCRAQTQIVRFYGGNCAFPVNGVRLYGVSSVTGMGYVQILINGAWGYICEDSWSQAAAEIVCNQLCYTNSSFDPLPAVAMNYVPYPSNRGISLGSVFCNGNEANILACNYTTGVGFCNFATAPLAGVQCLPLPPTAGPNNTNITGSPDMSCTQNTITLSFPLANFPGIAPAYVNIYPAPAPACQFTKAANSTFVSITFDVSPECGTVTSDNTTHITYENTVRYLWKSPTGVYYSQYVNRKYDVICAVPKDHKVTRNYKEVTRSPTELLTELTNLSFCFDLYNSSSFQNQLTQINGIYTVEVGDMICAIVCLESPNPRLKLVVDTCSASGASMVEPQVPNVNLILEKCPVQPDLTMYPLNNYQQGFCFPAICLTGYSMVYLSCLVEICLASSNAMACSRICMGSPAAIGRKKRQINSDGFMPENVNSPSIMLYDADSPDFVNFLGHAGEQAAISSKRKQEEEPDKHSGADQISKAMSPTISAPQAVNTNDKELMDNMNLSPGVLAADRPTPGQATEATKKESKSKTDSQGQGVEFTSTPRPISSTREMVVTTVQSLSTTTSMRQTNPPTPKTSTTEMPAHKLQSSSSTTSTIWPFVEKSTAKIQSRTLGPTRHQSQPTPAPATTTRKPDEKKTPERAPDIYTAAPANSPNAVNNPVFTTKKPDNYIKTGSPNTPEIINQDAAATPATFPVKDKQTSKTNAPTTTRTSHFTTARVDKEQHKLTTKLPQLISSTAGAQPNVQPQFQNSGGLLINFGEASEHFMTADELEKTSTTRRSKDRPPTTASSISGTKERETSNPANQPSVQNQDQQGKDVTASPQSEQGKVSTTRQAPEQDQQVQNATMAPVPAQQRNDKLEPTSQHPREKETLSAPKSPETSNEKWSDLDPNPASPQLQDDKLRIQPLGLRGGAATLPRQYFILALALAVFLTF